MGGVVGAFATIWAVTAVGWLIGRTNLLGPAAESVLARLVFFIATPALLFATFARSSLADVLSPALAAFVIGVVVLMAATVALARFGWRLSRGESVVAALCASYVNAANLGIPVASFVFGDFSVVAPVLLFQLLLAAPTALAILETEDPSRSTVEPGIVRRLILLPVRNPIMLASAAGLALALLGVHVSDGLLRPFQLVGQAAVPIALIALGASLGTRRTPAAVAPSVIPASHVPPVSPGDAAPQVATVSHGDAASRATLASNVDAVAHVEAGAVPVGSRARVASLVVAKVLVQPVVAYLVARYGFGLDGRVLLGVVIMSGLPTAQNVFVFAVRYQQGVALARGSVVGSTMLAVGSLALFAHLLS
jgi:predicted permease